MHFVFRLFYMWFLAVNARVKYYIAWILADLVCNASGFGFNGYDEMGKPKWDLLTNINIINFEVRTRLKIRLNDPRRINSEFCCQVCDKHEDVNNIVEHSDSNMAATGVLRPPARAEDIRCVCFECYMAWFSSWILFHVHIGRSVRACRPWCKSKNKCDREWQQYYLSTF